MEGRKKIAVVAGDLDQPRLLGLFELLRQHGEVHVFIMNTPGILSQAFSSHKLRVFEPVQDMPGYLRGLEDELSGFDLIIGMDTSRLATFQAVRAARKHGVPFAVVVNEYVPFFYEKYPNIRAIQYDICNKAQLFFATSRAAAQNLIMDQVPAESVRTVNPVVNGKRFRDNPAGREHFRKYVGIGPSEFVILWRADIDRHSRPEELMLALRSLKARLGSGASRLRVMFAANGDTAQNLKYLAYDLGLGRQVMFLHQDAEPFLHDLYAASDLLVVPKDSNPDFHEAVPLNVLDSMACGVVQCVARGTVAAEYAAEAAMTYREWSAQELAGVIGGLLVNPGILDQYRGTALGVVARDFSGAGAEQLAAEVTELLQSGRGASGQPAGMAIFRTEIQTALEEGREQDALLLIDEAFLSAPVDIAVRAELYQLKGHAYYATGRMDDAVAAYSESIKFNDKSAETYCGLGFVAWKSYSNEDALAFFRKALSINPENPRAAYGIGLVYRRLGLLEEAVYWLEKCIQAGGHPDSAVAALAQSCSQLNDHNTASEVLERAIEAVGESRTLCMTLGQIYINSGRISEGQAMLNKAMDNTSGHDAAARIA